MKASFNDASTRVAALCARDDDSVHPDSYVKFLSHGEKTPHAILFLHGFTDSPRQCHALAQQLYERGHNVLIPRLPFHGYRDRLTNDHAKLITDVMLNWTNEVADVAIGLGERVSVIGLSMGGVLATWVAQHRADVDQAVMIAPAFGTHYLPIPLTPFVTRLILRLPNRLMWWHPFERERSGHEYTYPRFATHPLASLFRMGEELLEEARRAPPSVRSAWMVTNANDWFVSNEICLRFVQAWQKYGTSQVHAYEFPRHYGIPHDCLDPIEIGSRPEIVFPVLMNIIERDET